MLKAKILLLSALTFFLSAPAFASGGGSGVVPDIPLGTSVSAANPHVIGDYTTGFFTNAAHHANVTINGSQVADWSSVGETINGGLFISGSITFNGLTTGTQISCLGLDSGNHIVLSNAACGTGGGAVASVFGRTGAVVATSGDYSVAQITGAAPLASPTFTGTVTLPAGQVVNGVTLSAINSAATYLDGAGAYVSPSVGQITGAAPSASPTFTGTVTLPAGQIVNGVTLNSTGSSSLYLSQAGTYSSPAGGGGLTVGTTTITSGTSGKVEFNNAGVLGEYTISGTGNVAMTTNPVFTTPNLGTPSAVTLTSGTGLPISTGVSGLGTGVATALATNVGSAGAPVVNGGVLGTPSSGTATNLTGLPISTGVSGLAAGVATFLATPSSANLATAVTDETGTGALMFAGSPTMTGTALAAAITASGVVTELNSVATGTGADTLPVGTTAQRPGSPAVGMIRYNSSAPPALEAYINGQWSALNGVPNVTYVANHTVNQGDMNGQINATGTWTFTIPAISTTVLPAGNFFCLNNQGSGSISVSSTPTINLSTGNVTSTTVASGQVLCSVSNGTSLDSYLIGTNGSMVYPGAGIANSTGSAWGTSYTTTGSGTVLALANAPTISGTTTFSGGITASGLSSGTVASNSYIGLDASNHMVLAGSSGSTAMSALTGATGANSIDGATNTQTWTWNTLAAGTGLSLTSSSTAAASNTQTLLNVGLTGANGTTTQTTTAAAISNAHTGTSSTNVALSLSASGGTTNIAESIPSGFVTIGTTTPLATPYNSQTGIVTIQGNQNASFVGLVVRNLSSGSASSPTVMVQNDGTDYTGFQVQPTTGSPAGSGLYYASKAITFLSDITVSGGGTDPIRFQSGGYSNATSMQITAGNPGSVQVDTTSTVTNAALNINGGVAVGSNLTFSATAPTVSSGFGTSPTFGTGSTATSWDLNVGTGGSATSGVITMPTTAHKWTCDVHDETSASTLVTVVSAQTTTSITLTSYSRTTGLSTAWNASDVVMGNCSAH